MGDPSSPANEPGVSVSHKSTAAAGQVKLLHSVIDALSGKLDIGRIVERVAELVTSLAGADVCFVHLLDEQRRELVLAGGTPPFDELAGSIRLALGEGVAGWVGLHGEPAVVPDKWTDSRYRYIPALRGEDFASLVSVPMMRGSRVVGVLNVHSKLPKEFSPSDVALLSDVASLLAGGVENALLYSSLEARERELEQFTAKTIDAQEAERTRLAGEIHDGISQCLISLGYRLDAALFDLSDHASVAVELSAAKSLLSQTLEEVRTAISGLRPRVLDDMGIGAALSSLAASVPQPEVSVEITAVVEEAHVQTALYRIAQEAVQNVLKHACASQITIWLGAVGDDVVLEVSDDGCGFAAGGERSVGYGLLSMRERAELLGGTLEVASRVGEGTTVRVTIPLGQQGRLEPDQHLGGTPQWFFTASTLFAGVTSRLHL